MNVRGGDGGSVGGTGDGGRVEVVVKVAARAENEWFTICECTQFACTFRTIRRDNFSRLCSH